MSSRDTTSDRRILVTGGTGQLATALAGRADVRRVGRPAFDFDRPETIEASFRAAAPRLVVNAAAYTAVDAAERDVAAAWRANRDGPAILARLCADAGIPLIHVSTDYVFDGTKLEPYVETDPVAPQGVYGASKLAGEQAVLAAGANAIILRTAWVYATTGRNFVRTMLTAGKSRDRLTVVADQHGCPTTADDLADAILVIARRLDRTGWQPNYHGVFHAAGTGATTWYGLAVATFEDAASHGTRIPQVASIATADWPTPAKRPANSRLDCTRLRDVFDVSLPHWRQSLTRTIDAIYATAPP
ncbi:dTDP-4-dehydrorhamnose reductase [Rhodopila sp.]|uniref:dTDP-4-dehydrorhamnose reductase n=1 Tax=Rhodopila sp. TaxID=2480087 RepID=UPI003D0F9F0D